MGLLEADKVIIRANADNFRINQDGSTDLSFLEENLKERDLLDKIDSYIDKAVGKSFREKRASRANLPKEIQNSIRDDVRNDLRTSILNRLNKLENPHLIEKIIDVYEERAQQRVTIEYTANTDVQVLSDEIYRLYSTDSFNAALSTVKYDPGMYDLFRGLPLEKSLEHIYYMIFNSQEPLYNFCDPMTILTVYNLIQSHVDTRDKENLKDQIKDFANEVQYFCISKYNELLDKVDYSPIIDVQTALSVISHESPSVHTAPSSLERKVLKAFENLVIERDGQPVELNLDRECRIVNHVGSSADFTSTFDFVLTTDEKFFKDTPIDQTAVIEVNGHWHYFPQLPPDEYLGVSSTITWFYQALKWITYASQATAKIESLSQIGIPVLVLETKNIDDKEVEDAITSLVNNPGDYVKHHHYNMSEADVKNLIYGYKQ